MVKTLTFALPTCLRPLPPWTGVRLVSATNFFLLQVVSNELAQLESNRADIGHRRQESGQAEVHLEAISVVPQATRPSFEDHAQPRASELRGFRKIRQASSVHNASQLFLVIGLHLWLVLATFIVKEGEPCSSPEPGVHGSLH